MKRHFLLLICCLPLGAAWAGTFTANNGQGTSTVGPAATDDYPSLAAAARDFSSRPGGCTGDWTLLINTPTLTEPNNIAFGNATNGFHVTVKPAPGISSEITFTTTTANIAGSYTGNWLIGTGSITNSADNMTTTSNFTIDGSNNGTSSRNLTIKNAPYTGDIQLIRVVGGCQNTTVRNAILVSNGSGQNFNVEFSCRRVGAAGPSYFPVGCRVENCDLTLVTGSNSQNILFRAVVSTGVTIPAGLAMDDVVITSNTIKGVRQPINLGFVKNALITDNALSVTVPLASSVTPLGMSHGANGTSGWTVNFSRNRFINWETLSTSQNGMGSQLDLGGGIVAPQTGTYEVTNNFFTGFQYNSSTAVTGTRGSYRAVNVSTTSASATVKVYHNSFNMPNQPLMANASKADAYNAVAVTAAGFTGSVDVKNNIFRYEQNNGVVFYRSNSFANAGSFASDYNTFHTANGAQLASYRNTALSANYSTLDAWKVAGFDTHSVPANPTEPAAPGLGKWRSSVDLHFDGDPSSIYRGSGVGVIADIDGESRNSTVPVIGADELPINAVITEASDWALFQ